MLLKDAVSAQGETDAASPAPATVIDTILILAGGAPAQLSLQSIQGGLDPSRTQKHNGLKSQIGVLLSHA